MGYLNLLHSGSSSGPNTANIILYPNESGYDEDACEGYVSDAIAAGFDDLTGNGLLGEYNVYEYESSSFPAYDPSSKGFDLAKSEFIGWLDDNSEYYPSKPGCHMLVASAYKDSGGPASSSYERDISINTIADCGFNTAQAMMLGLYDASTYKGKHENFAIQEPLHTFIPEDWIESNTSLLDSSSPEEHQLGYVTSGGASTPMLTGHAGPDDWYPSQKGRGECQTSWGWDGDHVKILTSCTKEAMNKTAKNA